MKITKYEHACVILEEQGKKLIIDPGEFTDDFGSVDNVVAVVVTHEHGDHFKPEALEAIVKANPDAIVFTTEEVAKQWHGKNVRTPEAYQDDSVGPFTLRFFGEEHAEIHHSVPRPQNIGVLVNELLYYPGDSFTPADRDFSVLAVPVSGPWLKMGEVFDFMDQLNFKTCFATHDALLNGKGTATANKWLQQKADELKAEYKYLQAGESIVVSSK